MRALRQPSRPRLRRWPETDRLALLHQLGGVELRKNQSAAGSGREKVNPSAPWPNVPFVPTGTFGNQPGTTCRVHRPKAKCALKGRWKSSTHFPSSFQDVTFLFLPGTLSPANFRPSLRDCQMSFRDLVGLALRAGRTAGSEKPPYLICARAARRMNRRQKTGAGCFANRLRFRRETPRQTRAVSFRPRQ